MSVLRHKTKGNESPRGLSAIFFCCHPNDFPRYFTQIAEELLRLHHCAVWYADPDTPRDEAFWEDIKEMDLFVVPVTADLLYTPSEAMTKELPFAIKNSISILPLMQEDNLVADFNRCELFRNRHFVNRYQPDTTALPYEEKLKNYLRSHLVDDDEAARIHDAFDSRIFLSYRKKDRRHAQELMRLIHKNDFCRDIAIWYDEYLIPGEDFNAGIEEALQKSDLFVLTVTPNVLEYVPDDDGALQKNYVVREEFPRADKADKPIVSAEMVATDPAALTQMFEKELQCADAHSAEALREALRSKLDMTKLRQNDNDPTHNYLIGLAYLFGVDMEKNAEQAITLITSASDAGLMEATAKLVNIYRNGIGVPTNINAVFSRQKMLIAQREQAYHAQPGEKTLNDWFWAVITYSDFYAELEQYRSAKAQLTIAANISRKVSKMDLYSRSLQYQAIVDERMGDILRKESNFDEAKTYYSNCLSLRKQILDIETSLHLRQCVCLAHERMGDVCAHNYEFDEAIEHYQHKLDMDRQFCAEGGSADDLLSLFSGLYKLAKTYLDSTLRMHAPDPGESLKKAAGYGEEALALADSFVTANDNPLARYRQSSIYTLMGKILLNDADLRKATGSSEEEYIPLYRKAGSMQQKGLQIAQAMHSISGKNLQSTQCLIAAYRALGSYYQVQTSEIFTFDCNQDGMLDYDNLPAQGDDRKYLEDSRAYYNKALDHAQALHRNFGILLTAQTLFHCRMDMASVIAQISRLPNEPKLYKLLQKQAMKHYDEALKLAQQLYNKAPNPAHHEQIASVYIHMATLGTSDKRKYLLEAKRIYQHLAKTYPKDEGYPIRIHGLQAMLDGKPGIFQID